MKKLLKKLFVPAFASRPVSALAYSIVGRGIPIFMMHRMLVEGQPNTGITPEHLRNCLDYLRDNDYTFVSLEQMITSLSEKDSLPDKAVVFTMDDGFCEQGQIAAPIFLEYDCPLTFFVITGLLDRSLWPWDAQVSWIIDNTDKKRLEVELADEALTIDLADADSRRSARATVRNVLKEMDAESIPELLRQLAQSADIDVPEIPPSGFKPLDWDQARRLEEQGVRFAPHSRSHRILSKLSRNSARAEIIGSWERVSSELRHPLKAFCYPTGRVLDFGPREIGILKEEGFIGAVATVAGYVEPNSVKNDEIFRLPRFELPDNMTDFIQYCSWIQHARRNG